MQVTPDEAWDGLAKDGNAVLVDCRTAFEWESIGIPDLSDMDRDVLLVEWRTGPNMEINPDFQGQLELAIGERQPDNIYFVCRSGQRSNEAASYYQEILSRNGQAGTCVNVAEGFEGNPNADGIRGQINGWQARGLSWRKGT